jgi:hypothetical protein
MAMAYREVVHEPPKLPKPPRLLTDLTLDDLWDMQDIRNAPRI